MSPDHMSWNHQSSLYLCRVLVLTDQAVRLLEHGKAHTQIDAQREPAVTVTESHVLGEQGRFTKQLSVCFPAFAGKVQRKRFQSTRESSGRPQQLQFHRLFCSLAVLDPRGLATPLTYFLHLSLSSVILIDSYTGSPVHVLMLPSRPCVAFLACVHLASLPCIISFSR